MQFILNTALQPHFCALFDEENNLIERHQWENNRLDGSETYAFLEKHNISEMKISFLGGVSGPGGFSSLRAGAAILNSLSVAKGIPIHQVRADNWIKAFLSSNSNPSELELSSIFLLNSFSDGVFLIKNLEKNLQRITVDEAVEKVRDQEVFAELLPEEKKEKFLHRKKNSFDNPETSLLEVLQESPKQKIFLPEYEFPPV